LNEGKTMMAGSVGMAGLIVVLGFYLLAGAVLLRAAVAVCNKLLPAAPSEVLPELAPVEKSQTEPAPVAQQVVQETDNPYATPQATEVLAAPAAALAIPAPTYGKAFGICAIAVVLNFMALGGLGFFVGISGQGGFAAEWLVGLIVLVGVFFIFTGLLKVMLPTSLGRSALVSAAFVFVAFLALFFVWLVMMGVMFVIGGSF